MRLSGPISRAGENLAYPLHEPRISTALRMERLLLVARYVSYFMVLAVYVLDMESEIAPPLLPVTLGAIIHNGFVHWVLYTGRYQWFLTPLNFFLHLGKISMLVGITGGEYSPLVFLYLVIIIGYCMYSVQFRRTYLVTLICAAAYSAVLLSRWTVAGIDAPYNPIMIHFFAIFLCGWLMSQMGEMLRTVELDAQSRAQALASSEATLRTILNTTASPILVCQENELIADVNNKACEYLGVKRRDLIGQRVRAFLFDDGTLPNKFASLRSRGEYQGEAIIITSNDDERSVKLLVRSFFRDNQRFFVAMLHDITEQKENQEKTRLVNLQLEAANKELQRVDNLRTAFFRTISQRLRSPLSAILGYNDMLLQDEFGELNPEQRSALQSCKRSLKRVFGLLDETMELEMSSRSLLGNGARKRYRSQTAGKTAEITRGDADQEVTTEAASDSENEAS